MIPYAKQICHMALEKLLIIMPPPTQNIPIIVITCTEKTLFNGPTNNPEKFVDMTLIDITSVKPVALPPDSSFK